LKREHNLKSPVAFPMIGSFLTVFFQ